MRAIPGSPAPFVQEYDIASLDPETASFTIIERTLQSGNREELHWLFSIYSRAQISDWAPRFGEDCLHQPYRAFWQTVLDINP